MNSDLTGLTIELILLTPSSGVMNEDIYQVLTSKQCYQYKSFSIKNCVVTTHIQKIKEPTLQSYEAVPHLYEKTPCI